MFIKKKSKNRQVFSAAVTHFIEGLSLEAYIKSEVPNLLTRYMEANRIHNRTKIDFEECRLLGCSYLLTLVLRSRIFLP
jgi:hypothetical protein